MSALIAELELRVRSGRNLTDMSDISKPKVSAKATAEQITTAESKLGFRLPELLRDIYTRVGNGGFGPGYGLIGVDGGSPDDQGHSLVQLYELYHRGDPADPLWKWDARLLPVCHWGCAIYSCLDCSVPSGPVVTFDPNAQDDDGSWDRAFSPHFNSLSEWLQLWLSGENLWQRMYPVAEQ